MQFSMRSQKNHLMRIKMKKVTLSILALVLTSATSYSVDRVSTPADLTSESNLTTLVPGVRYKQSQIALVPGVRYKQSQVALVPGVRYKRSQIALVPGVRYKQSQIALVPGVRYKQSQIALVPGVRYKQASSIA